MEQGALFSDVVTNKQGLSVNIPYPGYFADIWKRLFEEFSVNPFPKVLTGYPEGLRDYFNSLYYRHKSFLNIVNNGQFQFTGDKKDLPVFNTENSNKALIAFSGGKDSIAGIIKMREMGFEVYGLHLKGLNKAYPNEIEACYSIADKLNLPLIELGVLIRGKSDFPDNPVKNQFIISLMVDYGIRNGINNFSMGTHTVDRSERSNIYFSWSDAFEMIDNSNRFIQTVFPNYKYLYLLKDYTDAYKTIIDSGNGDLLNDLISCVLPLRYRESRKKGNEKKFGIKLMNNRCGSCQKCATEYINLMLLNVVPYNEAFSEHCIKILNKKVYEVYGIREEIESREDLLSLYVDFNNCNKQKIKKLL